MNNIHIYFEKENCFKINKYLIKYKGLIFYKNYMAGKDSIVAFFKDYKSKFMENIEHFRGNFIISIDDSKKNTLFTDNSGMYRIYYYNNYIFDKYLDLIKNFKFKLSDIEKKSMVEYIQYGYSIFFTPIKNVKILNRSDFIILSNNKIHVASKKIPTLFDKGEDMLKFYNNLENNLKNKKIACDLTAGIDSRLNVSLLIGSNIKFKTTISGQKEHIDVKKCHEISKTLNLKTLEFDLDDKINYSIIDDIFKQLDGQYSILEFYKNYVLTQGLIKNDINVRISGAGGELYKYSWFAEDFPFFNKKNFSLNKVYNKRFFSKSAKYNFYTIDFKKEIDSYQNDLLNLLEKYRYQNNVKTYDRLCYELIMRYGTSTQMIYINDRYIRYTPLLEFSIVRNGVNLSVKDRLLYMLHRYFVSNLTPTTAKIKTNKNLTVSKSTISIIRDFLYLFKEFIIKSKNKILKTNIFKSDSANSDNIYQYVKDNDQKLIKLLGDNNIIDIDKFNRKEIDNATYSRLITVAKIIDFVGENNEK